jgi:HK97 family phage major capsid protein
MTITAWPTDAVELEEMLNDSAKAKEIFSSDESRREFETRYAMASAKKDPGIIAQLKEQNEKILQEFFIANREAGNTPVNQGPPTGQARGYFPGANPKAVGAGLNGKFTNMADFFQAVWRDDTKGAHGVNDSDVNNRLQEIKAYQERVPSDGGFLVPEEFRAEILRLTLEKAIVRPRARVMPMSSKTLSIPMIDSTSNVSSVYGGVVVYRTAEGASLNATKAKFGLLTLDASKQTALAEVTNELLADAAGGFAMWLNEIFPEAMSYYEDLDFLGGNGAGVPLGALNAANGAIIQVSKETGQTTGSLIVWENVIKMYARMLPSSLPTAVWIASPDTFAELATMALSVGTGGSAVWLVDGRGTPVLTLLGRPVILSEKAPAALGTKGDLSFVDFSQYIIGDRQQMTIKSSEHAEFTEDRTVFRVIQRNDGRPWLQSAITPHNNSATLSAFVQLETRV